jgi:hypothetical protein
MRYTLGLAVFSGMLGVILFGIVFTPVFYVVIRWQATTPAISATAIQRKQGHNGM